jgi:hypothetical protein
MAELVQNSELDCDARGVHHQRQLLLSHRHPKARSLEQDSPGLLAKFMLRCLDDNSHIQQRTNG